MAATRPYAGVVSTGIYIPQTYHTAEYIALESGVPQDVIEKKMGFYKKPVAGPEEGTAAMGILAARQAIANAGIDPQEIDLVIYIGEEYKEYQLWTAGIKTAFAVGATRAWAFDTQLRCGTWVLGMKLAESLIISDPSINTVLLAGGYRNGDFIDYKNPRVSFMYNLGAGGGAMILKRNYGRNRVIGSDMIVDGSLSETVGVLGGGTKSGLRNHEDALYQLDVLDPELMKTRLGEVSNANFVECVRRAVGREGYTPGDIGYIAILHMKYSAHKLMLGELGLSEAKSIYLSDYGHIGQIDQILSIHLALEQGKIKDGDLVVGVSAGVGYAWGATAIKWGPVEEA
ncbi:MAG TPA: 3-oxoacyl-ACP synthase [Symbiobacteriaceae bacterium]|jgi:3-oxoacyl-[acyl-carrier-protein] synthase-3|nr:3-oxoacyl-ACP synthase [Symbiobacteriaceae bacterium]